MYQIGSRPIADATKPTWKPALPPFSSGCSHARNRRTLSVARPTCGSRIKRTRLIQTEKYVVAIEVEMVIPPGDPSEPCNESDSVQLLREIKEHAERGGIQWLKTRGSVYTAVQAA